MPERKRQLQDLGTPVRWADERDIMFSRALLEPGTERYEAYYGARPHLREKDDLFRKEAGLLKPGTTQHHLLGFAAADAAFWTVEKLRAFVEGDGGAPGAGTPSAAPRAPSADTGPATPPPADGALHPDRVTRFLKAWALKLGAHSVGVTPLRDYHLYTHVGRGPEYGEPVTLHHTHALALTVEMDREMVDRAPASPTVMESARRYLDSGVLAVQLAEAIRRLGYRAHAHIDGCYRVICPLVARDAGLGEIGRMGLLMTPRLGPRVRIAVVTTDLPLVADPPARDLTVLDFCARCRKCADACPARALPSGPPEADPQGVVRWRVDAEACYTLWTRLGTDCARCMAVCPYSHPDTLVHNLVRWGIRRSALARRAAVWMDDVVYGRRPAPRPLPGWMEGGESRG
jgi:ferredoxin